LLQLALNQKPPKVHMSWHSSKLTLVDLAMSTKKNIISNLVTNQIYLILSFKVQFNVLLPKAIWVVDSFGQKQSVTQS